MVCLFQFITACKVPHNKAIVYTLLFKSNRSNVFKRNLISLPWLQKYSITEML